LWIHDSQTDPVELYCETNDQRWETRKVEVFRDGSIGFASATESSEGTILGESPIPPIEEIAADPEFKPQLITKEEFETVWSRRLTPAAVR
jgi:hypothetical protein